MHATVWRRVFLACASPGVMAAGAVLFGQSPKQASAAASAQSAVAASPQTVVHAAIARTAPSYDKASINLISGSKAGA